MSDGHWWQSAKIYELYVDLFAGDLRGLTKRMDYFLALGIDCLHILPHYPSPMYDGGYDVSDYRGVRAELGTLADFEAMAHAAHERGIRIIIDLVLNHTSTEHPWFLEAKSSRTNARRHWYLWSNTGTEFPDAINPMPSIKPHNWLPTGSGDYYFSTFFPQQADLNWDNPEVFDEIVSVMEFWIRRGVSGFRLDAAPFLIKREGTNCANVPETHNGRKHLRTQITAKYPDVILMPEAAVHSYAYFGDGAECQVVYNFYLNECFWMSLMWGDDSRTQRAIDDTRNIPAGCAWANFLRNHDSISFYSIDDNARQDILHRLDPSGAYLQDHQAAVRVAQALQGDEARILHAFELLYSAPGASIMYYGDEIGMRNLPPRDDVHDKRLYVRGKFDWTEAVRQMRDPNSLFSKTAVIIKRK